MHQTTLGSYLIISITKTLDLKQLLPNLKGCLRTFNEIATVFKV
jgi:hypothetical protein